jgi:hypothetical protein
MLRHGACLVALECPHCYFIYECEYYKRISTRFSKQAREQNRVRLGGFVSVSAAKLCKSKSCPLASPVVEAMSGTSELYVKSVTSHYQKVGGGSCCTCTTLTATKRDGKKQKQKETKYQSIHQPSQSLPTQARVFQRRRPMVNTRLQNCFPGQ